MTTPPDFVHLHVHSQYSILDGQASIQKLVDKAMRDGQPGIALTDHGNMFGIKEFYNYVKKVKGKYKAQAAEAEARLAALVDGSQAPADPAEIARCRAELADLKRKAAFKPIIGSEVYVARRRMQDKEGKPDQSGYHLILLAKNLKGYHNLIKIVSKAWTEGFYMRPRTDRVELEKYHEGLICCSACLAGEVPRAITANDLEKAEESIRWHKKVFGDDYYLELQLHKATVERANHEAYPMQLHVNKHLRQLAAKHNVRMVCTNDVHFVDEDNAEAHDRLICLSTGKDLDDPKRMLYSKQEWLKTTAEMASIFGESDPEAMATTVDICNQVECYSIDHAPIMPTFEIPAEFGTEEEYRARYTEQDLYDEFEENDPRREATIINPADDQMVTPSEEIYLGNRYLNRKYAMMTDNGGAPYRLSHETRSPINNKQIRYADVLLMYAEACLESNTDLGAGRNALNRVRARVGLSEVDLTRENLRHERRVELAMEGHRWFDLCRWGIVGETMNAYMAAESEEARAQMGTFIAGKHELMPIPSEEVRLGGLTQNPGY